MNTQAHAAFIAPAAVESAEATPVQAYNIGALLQRLPVAQPSLVLPGAVLALMFFCAVAPGWIAPYGPMDMDVKALLAPPSLVHPFGTDHLGRDIFSLIVFGARQSILVAVSAVAVGIVIGAPAGIICGYLGKGVDAAFTRFLEVWLAIPDILMVIVVATALQASLTNIVLTIGVVSAPRFARIMRSQVIGLRNRPFVEAARAIGASDSSILFRHILPHSVSPLLVLATIGIGTAAQTGAALSFIGLGLVANIPDWGYLLNQARGYLSVAWWFGAFPGLAITVLVIAANLLGGALRQSLDPRQQPR